MNAILETRNLSVGYPVPGKAPGNVLQNLSLKLQEGELTALMGPNGSGKSTLLKTLANILPPVRGEVLIRGQSTRRSNSVELAREMAIVLTERYFPIFLTVEQIVGLGRIPHTNRWGTFTRKDNEAVDQAMEVTGSMSLRKRQIGELSDGEKQKVMIARALSQQPKLLLLDEPSAFLDLVGKIEIFSLLKKISRENNTTVLISTHDFDVATKTADCVWLIQPGEKISVGAPEDLMLSGLFEKVFRNEAIRFDIDKGSFLPNYTPEKSVRLHGEGILAGLTAKALERIGLAINNKERNTPLQITVSENDGNPSWKLITPEETTVFNSIYDLVLGLRKSG